MLFDNIILFLNVLEQFAIRVTIFGLSIEEIITSVNQNWFTNNEDYIQNLIKVESNDNNLKLNPYDIVKLSNNAMDYKLFKNGCFYENLTYVNKVNHIITGNQITFIY